MLAGPGFFMSVASQGDAAGSLWFPWSNCFPKRTGELASRGSGCFKRPRTRMEHLPLARAVPATFSTLKQRRVLGGSHSPAQSRGAGLTAINDLERRAVG